MLQKLRLPIEIRGFPGTGIFLYHQQLGLWYFTYSLPKPVPLKYLKNAKNIQNCCIFWGYFLKKYFFVEKLRQLEKNICSTSETKQKYLIRYFLTNLKTCKSINPQFVTIKHPEVFNCVSYYLVQFQLCTS